MQILRLGPGHGLPCFDDQDRVAQPTHEICSVQLWLPVECGIWSNEYVTYRVPGRKLHLGRLAWRQCVVVWHPGQKCQVVRTVPRFIKMKLLGDCFVEIREKKDS